MPALIHHLMPMANFAWWQSWAVPTETIWPTKPETLRFTIFSGGSDSKESSCKVGDPGLIPESGRSPGEGTGNPLQYSCLENPMDRGAWWATVHVVSESDMTEWLDDMTWHLQKSFQTSHLKHKLFCCGGLYYFLRADITKYHKPGDFYGLYVRVPLNSYIEVLRPRVMVFEEGIFGRWLGSDEVLWVRPSWCD